MIPPVVVDIVLNQITIMHVHSLWSYINVYYSIILHLITWTHSVVALSFATTTSSVFNIGLGLGLGATLLRN